MGVPHSEHKHILTVLKSEVETPFLSMPLENEKVKRLNI